MKKVEDCFDGSSVFSYEFDEAITREAIFAMKVFGELDYFPDFPRPFFRVRSKSGAQAKGVQGDLSCRVIYPKKDRESIKRDFENIFKSCD